MRTNYHSKTLGPQAAKLVTTLHEQRRMIFRVRDVMDVTGLAPKAARNFAATLVHRGVAMRLKPGLLILVPLELGRECEYLGNPYLVARALAANRQYFISHASAMDLHGMLTQPQLVIHVTTPAAVRGRTILGTQFRFVRCRPEHIFGTVDHWIDKTEQVVVSSIERTVIDGLKQPEYCGGFSEVAKGFWMRRADIEVARLVDVALRLDIGAVIRRLGFLLDICGIDAPAERARLQRRLTATYHLLDPTLPDEGKRLARWRIRVNVTPEEVVARGTVARTAQEETGRPANRALQLPTGASSCLSDRCEAGGTGCEPDLPSCLAREGPLRHDCRVPRPDRSIAWRIPDRACRRSAHRHAPAGHARRRRGR